MVFVTTIGLHTHNRFLYVCFCKVMRQAGTYAADKIRHLSTGGAGKKKKKPPISSDCAVEPISAMSPAASRGDLVVEFL